MDIPRQQNKFRRNLMRALGAGAVLGVLALITLGLSRLQPADPTVERTAVVIDTVKRGPMLREVRGYGKLVPEESHWIPATTQGRVERILVQRGAVVQPQTVLIEMSNAELAQDVSSAEMDVKAAEADYTNLRVRLEKENLDQKSYFASVQSAYSQAVLEAQLYQQLAQEGLKSELELKTAQNKAEEMTTRFEIEKQRLEISKEAVDAQLAAQRARVDQFRAKAELKRSQLEALRVRAGTAGVLVLLPVEVGQQVTPGMNLARVANPQRLKAEIKIPETQAKDIQMGLTATVDTHNGMISGHVAQIDAAVQEGSVTVDLIFDSPLPQGARQDLSVDGTIELERLGSVLFVGRPTSGQEKSVVSLFRLENQGRRATRVQVQLGRASVNAVEILDGLREGDQVIISDMSAWDSFDHIQLN